GRDHQKHIRYFSGGDPAFLTRQQMRLPVRSRSRAHCRRVTARLRLGERKRRDCLAAREAGQPGRLLRRRSPPLQHLADHSVNRQDAPDGCAARTDRMMQKAHADVVYRTATVVPGDIRAHEPFAGELTEQLARNRLLLIEFCGTRGDDLARKRAGPLPVFALSATESVGRIRIHAFSVSPAARLRSTKRRMAPMLQKFARSRSSFSTKIPKFFSTKVINCKANSELT